MIGPNSRGGGTSEGWWEKGGTGEGEEMGLQVTVTLFFMLFCIFKMKTLQQHKYSERILLRTPLSYLIV